MTIKHDTCIKEDQIQNQSRIIERLDAHRDNDTKMIDELKYKIEMLDKKVDALLEGFNKLKLDFTTDDKNLEVRLKTIETKIESNEKAIVENRDKSRFQLNLLGLVFTGITVIATILSLIIRMF